MKISELIKEAHENAIEKGFYECRDCEGKKYIGRGSHFVKECPECNGTGIDQNKNIPEMLMLIISEISEAVEALRCGKFTNCDIEDYSDFDKESYPRWFERHIKDTFEDEIADFYIRLFDLCGYLEIEYVGNSLPLIKFDKVKNITHQLFYIAKRIMMLDCKYLSCRQNEISDIFNNLDLFCEHNNIDIEKHIKAKMEYNKTRPKKHNKEF